MKPMSRIRRILALKLGGIGDVLMITPSLAALREAFPRAHIALVVDPASREVVEDGGWADEVILLPSRARRDRVHALSLLCDLGALLRVMRRVFRGFDLFVEFQNPYSFRSVLKPLLIGMVSAAPVRAGIDIRRHAFFLNVRVPEKRLEAKLHSERYLDILRALEIPIRQHRTLMPIPERFRAEASRRFADLGIRDGNAVVGIHCGGNRTYPLRTTWPTDRFAAVARRLLRRGDTHLLLTGAPWDRDRCLELFDMIATPQRVSNLAGETSLKLLGAYLMRCSLFISNDTGPMHVAVAVGTPTVGIFGPGDWQAYGTYPADVPFRMVRGHVDCWPCTNLQCTTRKCMNVVSVEQVLAAAEALLPEAKR